MLKFFRRRKQPESTQPIVHFNQASSWAYYPLSRLLQDDQGRELFRSFLEYENAESNLDFFVEMHLIFDVTGEERRSRAEKVIEKFSNVVHLSQNSLEAIKNSTSSGIIHQQDWATAYDEIDNLLNDKLNKFRISRLHFSFVISVLPLSKALQWRDSFNVMLSDRYGRNLFRLFLNLESAEHIWNMNFIDEIVQYRQKRGDDAITNAKELLATYLHDNAPRKVDMDPNIVSTIEVKIMNAEMNVSKLDLFLYDEASAYTKEVLRKGAFHKYINSERFANLLTQCVNDQK